MFKAHGGGELDQAGEQREALALHVRVFDGARTIERTTVVVENGLIRSVGP